jgi:beta-glucosidase
MNSISVVILSTAVVFSATAALSQGAAPTSNTAIEARAEALLKQMTLDEKLGQLSQIFWDKTLKDDRIQKGELGSYLFLTDPHEINRVQHVAVEQSRLHIPLLIGFDVIHGFRTIFPVPIAQAASWDLDMNREIQSAAAAEASAVGINWAFAPMVDIARDARWGRIVEGAGEDPYLGSKMAAARVQGFQGAAPDAPNHILACAKHFAGYGAAVGGRDYDASYLSDTELQNVYLPPFHAAVDAGVACIMSAYMDLNDVPASGNRWLLRDVLGASRASSSRMHGQCITFGRTAWRATPKTPRYKGLPRASIWIWARIHIPNMFRSFSIGSKSPRSRWLRPCSHCFVQ